MVCFQKEAGKHCPGRAVGAGHWKGDLDAPWEKGWRRGRNMGKNSTKKKDTGTVPEPLLVLLKTDMDPE